jgi:hypothetical protein
MPGMRPPPPDAAARARIAEALAKLPDGIAWYSQKFTWRAGEPEPIPDGSYVILTDGRAGRVKGLEPEVRIHSPPAESPQTFGSSSRRAAKPPRGYGRD